MILDPMEWLHTPFRVLSVSIDFGFGSNCHSCSKCTVGAFSIDRTTGVVTVSGSLDSETLDR